MFGSRTLPAILFPFPFSAMKTLKRWIVEYVEGLADLLTF